MSSSAIFTVQPAAAYSRATRRLMVLLPTPPFCETTPIITVISVFLGGEFPARKHAYQKARMHTIVLACKLRIVHEGRGSSTCALSASGAELTLAANA